MKAYVLKDIGNIVYEDVANPVLTVERDVLVKIHACGICSSDIPRVFTNGTYNFPTIPGHEFSGEIVDTFDGDKTLIGKKVVIFPLLPCNQCPSCKEKNYALCDNYNYFGSRCDGGFAEYIAVPKWNLNIIDNEIPYDVGALMEPSAVALHAVRKIKGQNVKDILVIGSGTIGILVAFWCKKLFNSNVYIQTRNQFKKTLIESIGFFSYDQNANDKNFNAIFECVGSNECVEEAIERSGKGASIVLVGNPNSDMKFDKKIYWKILRSEINVIGTWNSDYKNDKDDWKYVSDNMLEDVNFYKKLITHKFKLHELEKGLNLIKNREDDFIKVMVENE